MPSKCADVSTESGVRELSTVQDSGRAASARLRESNRMTNRRKDSLTYREDAVATLEAHTDAVIREVNRLAVLAGIDVVRVKPGAAPRAVLQMTEEPGSHLAVRARFHPAYASYFASGSVVITLPEQAEDLLELLLAAGSTRRGAITGVVGAHGGAGASLLASWLARILSDDDGTGLIDLDPLSLGLADGLGLQSSPGLRWADLNEDAGALVPGRLSAALPHLGDLRVLSADDRGAVPSSGESGARAISALSQVHAHTVLDLPRDAGAADSHSREWLEWCDTVVVITHPTTHGLKHTQQILSNLPSHGRGIVAVNRAGSAGEVAALALELGDQTVLPVHRLRNLEQDLAHGIRLGDRSRSVTARDISKIALACQENT